MALEDEVRLVSRVLQREPRALDEFIFSYRPFIYAVLARHLRLSREDADDLYQHFLIHIWESDFRRLRRWSGRSSLTAYLGKVVRNLARDHLRQRIRVVSDAFAASVPDCSGELERKDMVEKAMRKLSPRDRDLLHRRYYMDQSYREIADALQITTNNVGVSLLRAEQRLKKKFSRLL